MKAWLETRVRLGTRVRLEVKTRVGLGSMGRTGGVIIDPMVRRGVFGTRVPSIVGLTLYRSGGRVRCRLLSGQVEPVDGLRAAPEEWDSVGRLSAAVGVARRTVWVARTETTRRRSVGSYPPVPTSVLTGGVLGEGETSRREWGRRPVVATRTGAPRVVVTETSTARERSTRGTGPLADTVTGTRDGSI